MKRPNEYSLETSPPLLPTMGFLTKNSDFSGRNYCAFGGRDACQSIAWLKEWRKSILKLAYCQAGGLL
jgi:drug/metabolite transporter superfamily protein YnfA